MSSSVTRTVPLRGASGTGTASGHPWASSARRATLRAYPMKARPHSSSAMEQESCAREEMPRAARRGESSRQARAASGATTTMSEQPSPTSSSTARQTSSLSAEGPAGSSMRTAPVALAGSETGPKIVARSSASSSARAPPAPALPRSRTQTSKRSPSPSTRARSARRSQPNPARMTGGTSTPALASTSGSSAMTSQPSTSPCARSSASSAGSSPTRARSASLEPSGAAAPSVSHGRPTRERSASRDAVPTVSATGKPGLQQARRSTRAASRSREAPSATRRPSPQTSQRSDAHASGVLTVTPSVRPWAASARCTSSAWAKLGTSTTARPCDERAPRTRETSSSVASPSAVVA